jgi:MraZ protein
MAFRGTFDYTLDAKNRLTVPAKFRASLSEGVVLAKGTAACVAIWTPQGFDSYVDAALADMHPLNPEADKLNRFFQANSLDTELDAAGRVMVPGFLL